MRAVTVWQPWATLIALGVKRNETRSWRISKGTLVVHAAARVAPGFRVGTCVRVGGPWWVERNRDGLVLLGTGRAWDLPLGAVVAIADVIDVRHTDSLDPDPVERALGDYTAGRYAWRLAGLHRLPEPVPARGGQRVWNWQPPPELLAATRYHGIAR